MIIKYFFIFIFFFIATSGCSKDVKVINITIGSDYSDDGIITDKNLSLNFIRFKDKKDLQDLVNSIYFAGDTICFSILINKKNAENIKFKAYYIGGNKFILETNKKLFYNKHIIPAAAVPMERVDYFKNRISGFSLVGSILEHTYKRELTDKIDISIFSVPHYVLYLFIINDTVYKAKIIKFNI